jgi:hypothetical protein
LFHHFFLLFTTLFYFLLFRTLRPSPICLTLVESCIYQWKMERGREHTSFPPKFYSRTQELIFCKSDQIVWKAYHYESAKHWIHHPVRVQRGLVTRLGTSVVVSRVSGGDYQFSESVCIESRRDLERRILGGFRQEFYVTTSAHPRWLLCISCLSFGDFPGLLVDSSGSVWRFPFETWRVVYKCQDVLRPRVSCLCLSWLCHCRSKNYCQIGEIVSLVETSNQVQI